ncbi:superoxide dismutase family protein [Acinetobacter sp. WCHAc010052]|uniref:superoxide dismutase family protein n=1 Tax=Acinetobacter sp. WCHAc010052 TaxID=2004647 RepID=UPI000B3C6846|nr:superoxide dismutase family protein [Acinetobacter sp. WCHAc010052]AXY58956.1 superoxide dismutase [Acinetobacter sp. WCHAc010052]
MSIQNAVGAVLLSSIFAAGCASTGSTSGSQSAASKTVDIHEVSAQGVGQKIGTVEFKDSLAGLAITTKLSELPPGPHGFHIHEKGSCEAAEKDGKMTAALAAGGHFNPEQRANHGNPLAGHKGDLPVLNVDASGHANTRLLAPRLKVADIEGLAVMVHAGGDNYSDTPAPLGGGGARIACGVIQ